MNHETLAQLRLVEPEDRVPAILDLPLTTEFEVLCPRNAIHWIDTPAALRSLCQDLRRQEVVGLDVETALDFGTLCLRSHRVPSCGQEESSQLLNAGSHH